MSDPIFNFHDTLLLATSFQSLMFVVLILFVKQERHLSDYFLVGFFLAQALIPIHILVNFGEMVRAIALESSPNWFHALEIALWLEGPLLLWYTRSVLYKDFSLSLSDLAFLVPTIFYLVYVIPAFYLQDLPTKALLLEQYRRIEVPSSFRTIDSGREIMRVLFGVFCLMVIKQARKQIRDRYSNIERIDFGWLSYLVIAFIIARGWIVLVLLITNIAPDLGAPIYNYMGLVGNYLTFALITTLMFYSLQRSTLFEEHITEKDNKQAKEEEVELDPQLTKRIEDYMTSKKPYLMHSLNLEQLSTQLEMHPRALSVTIKRHFKTNFYEFVNSYRIAEAKALLANPEMKKKTMIEISGECGFNSKATYNTFFKKLVGLTPTQYRTQKLADLSTKHGTLSVTSESHVLDQ